MSYDFTLVNVTPANVERLLTVLRDTSTVTDIPGLLFSWSIEGSGIKADASYDPEKKALVISILDKPAFVTVEYIKQQVLEALNG
jgi:hypothetical protein